MRHQSKLPMGLFGASTGAAAALVVAAARPTNVHAVVSRGGRPDLAGDALGTTRAPTLLIVGGEDQEVLELNRKAMARMTAEAKIEVVPGASHLFHEPGALETVSHLAAEWFTAHLVDIHR
jgi:pimeloyl-ACP methyl ester carboxylesterase